MPGAVFVWNLLVFCSEFLNKVKLRSKLVKQNNNVLKCVEKINWFCAAREWNSGMSTVGWCKSFYLYQQIQIFLSSWKMSEKTQSICLLITSLLLFVNLLNVERILGEKMTKETFFPVSFTCAQNNSAADWFCLVQFSQWFWMNLFFSDFTLLTQWCMLQFWPLFTTANYF